MESYTQIYKNKVTSHSLELLENRMRKRVSTVLNKFSVNNRIDRFNLLQIVNEIMEIDPISQSKSPKRSSSLISRI